MAQITVGGTGSPGAAPQDNPVYVAGSDGTNVRVLTTDSGGRLLVAGAGAAGSAYVGNPVLAAGGDGSNARIIGVNAQNQVFVLTEGQKATYTATAAAFLPVATATDFISIFGSASKTIRVLRVAIGGVATAGTIVDLYMIKRSSANSAGTPTALTAIPHDANDASASAAVNSYAANPTTGSAIGNIGIRKLSLPTAASNIVVPMLEWRPGTQNDRAWVLRGAAQGLCLNWNGAAIPAGTSLDVEITWTEE